MASPGQKHIETPELQHIDDNEKSLQTVHKSKIRELETWKKWKEKVPKGICPLKSVSVLGQRTSNVYLRLHLFLTCVSNKPMFKSWRKTFPLVFQRGTRVFSETGKHSTQLACGLLNVLRYFTNFFFFLHRIDILTKWTTCQNSVSSIELLFVFFFHLADTSKEKP